MVNRNTESGYPYLVPDTGGKFSVIYHHYIMLGVGFVQRDFIKLRMFPFVPSLLIKNITVLNCVQFYII